MSGHDKEVVMRDPDCPKPSVLPRLLDIAGVAEHLAVSEQHIRRLVAERRIPYVKWGYVLRFDPEEIATWLDDARKPVAPPPPVLSRSRLATRALGSVPRR
jgi:excisionase family DNA binding protein